MYVFCHEVDTQLTAEKKYISQMGRHNKTAHTTGTVYYISTFCIATNQIETKWKEKKKSTFQVDANTKCRKILHFVLAFNTICRNIYILQCNKSLFILWFVYLIQLFYAAKTNFLIMKTPTFPWPAPGKFLPYNIISSTSKCIYSISHPL